MRAFIVTSNMWNKVYIIAFTVLVFEDHFTIFIELRVFKIFTVLLRSTISLYIFICAILSVFEYCIYVYVFFFQIYIIYSVASFAPNTPKCHICHEGSKRTRTAIWLLRDRRHGKRLIVVWIFARYCCWCSAILRRIARTHRCGHRHHRTFGA